MKPASVELSLSWASQVCFRSQSGIDPAVSISAVHVLSLVVTATIAATMQPDSHLGWNRAVQISGTKMTMPTPEADPAARVSASTDPVYASGISTDSQPGSSS